MSDNIARDDDAEFNAMWIKEYAPRYGKPAIENLCYQAMYAGWLRGRVYQIKKERASMQDRPDAMTDDKQA